MVKIKLNEHDKISLTKLILALNKMPYLGKPKIDLVKLRAAYQSININIKII